MITVLWRHDDDGGVMLWDAVTYVPGFWSVNDSNSTVLTLMMYSKFG